MTPWYALRKSLVAGLLAFFALSPALAGGEGFLVGASTSGAFFDESHEGEGFVVEVFEDGTALVYWFSYTPDGEQRWFFGVGRIETDRIIVDELLTTTSGEFGDGFDPDSVEVTTAGSVTLTFSRCNVGRADFVIDGEAGEQILARLTGIAGLGCNGSPADMPAGYSGSFADPLFNGQGFIVQVLSETQALVFWFTYDREGRQAWIFGVGEIVDGRITVNEATITSGGRFGPDFDPAEVEKMTWGAFELDLVCGGGLMNYEASFADYGAGYQQPLRITGMADAVCERERITEMPPNCRTVARTAIKAGWLDNGTHLDPVDNSAFLPAAGCKAADHQFNGTLTVSGGTMQDAGDQFNPPVFPTFSADFTTVGSYLLPLNREIIAGPPGSFWNIILSPGRVWRENGDSGRSRASFPFTLTASVWNQAHNGVATFLFDDETVTGLRIQIAQETTAWNKTNYWGQMSTSFAAKFLPDARAEAVRFEHELTSRYAVRDWSELEALVGADSLSTFTRFQGPADVSLTGMAMDNVLYLKSPATRLGPYPYPEEMRSGVYSVTKTSAAALSLLWLAQEYGEDVFDLKIADYVDVTATHDGWDNVTFEHVIDMMAGIGNNSADPNINDTYADEVALDAFGLAPTVQAKLGVAFDYGNFPWGPGEIVRYNSTHTFVLGAAMDAFFKSVEGSQANLWESVIEHVLVPMGLRAIPMLETRELAEEDRLPIMAWGRYLTADDAIKIARLFQNDGHWGVRQLLHPGRTREALRKSGPAPWPTSLVTPLADGGTSPVTYKSSVWGFDMPTHDCTVSVNFMWGYGGNYVLMLPNNMTAFVFADSFVFDVPGMAWATHQVRSLC